MALQAVDSYDKLFLKCDGTTTTFTDSSLSPKTVTANGTATQYSKKINGYAGFFNGTTDYVRIADSSDFDFGTGDFDIEVFVNFTTVQTCHIFDFALQNLALIYTVNTIRVQQAGSTRINTAWTPTANTWYHLRIQRSSGTTSLYIDNTLTGTPYAGSDTCNCGATGLFIGKTSDAAQYFAGWMKEFRVSTVTRSVAIPTSQYTLDSNTKVLMHFDTTADCPIGPAIYLDGTGDYLSAADHADWDFGTGDFCLETFFTFLSGATFSLIEVGDSASVGAKIVYSGGNLQFVINGSTVLTSAYTFIANGKYHVAASRSGSTAYLFVNGVLLTSGANSSNITGSTAGVRIGSSQLNQYTTGYLREIRISNTSRYTSTFTPTQSGFTVDSNTKLYVKGDESNGAIVFVDSSTSPKTITTNGDAKIKWIEDYRCSIFKDAAGKFPYPNGLVKIDFFCLGSSVASFTNATSSYLSIPDSDDWYFNADFTQEAYIRLPVLNVSTYFFGQSTDSLNATVLWYEQSTPYLGYRDYVANSNVLAFQADPKFIVNTWFHIALTRSGNDFTIWVNGTSIATVNQNVTYSNVSGNFYVGADNALTWSFAGQKLMDNIRISKGTARYTSTFNPPFEPASSSTSSGAGVSAVSTFLMIF